MRVSRPYQIPDDVRRVVLLVAGWFSCHILFNAEIKKALPRYSNPWGVLEASALQLLVSAALGYLASATQPSGEASSSALGSRKRLTTYTASFCHLIAIMSANLSYLLIGSTLTQILKALEGCFALLFEVLFQRKWPTTKEAFAVILITSSAAFVAFPTVEDGVTRLHYVTATVILSNCMYPLRNILTTTQQFGTGPAVLSMYSGLCIPIISIALVLKIKIVGMDGSVHTLSSAFLFTAYQSFSFECLRHMTITTHALLNVLKRTLSILCTMALFHDFQARSVLGAATGSFGMILHIFNEKKFRHNCNVLRHCAVVHLDSTSTKVSVRLHKLQILLLCTVLAYAYFQGFHPTGQLFRQPVHSKVVSIWTYPSTPLADDNGLLPDRCIYHTCPHNVERLNIVNLVENGPYASFIRNHAFQKIRHMESFVHHIQAVVLLSYVRTHPEKCARTHGNHNTICVSSLSEFESYNPETSSTLPPDKLVSKNVLLQVNFSTLSFDSRVSQVHTANSGDEVQGIPGIQFMPYLSGHADRERGLYVWGACILLLQTTYTLSHPHICLSILNPFTEIRTKATFESLTTHLPESTFVESYKFYVIRRLWTMKVYDDRVVIKFVIWLGVISCR
mmetsp:Transcript_8523/g.28664  ORF Transcript_8523/g.28664 Transcript_8523/m.28664 type:complete len:621 (-) Transcript_8523:2089-3951(-)